MKENKGILGKLLSVIGVVLVTAGVFAFQVASSAEDGGTPAAGSNVVVADPDTEDETTDIDPDNNSSETNTEETNNENTEENEPAQTYDYAIKYYKITEEPDPENEGKTKQVETLLYQQDYTGVETEHKFNITDFVPEGEGDFLGWLDTNNKKYVAEDEVTLKSDTAELKLIAKFGIKEKFTLIYYANGGTGAPAAQSCESYDGTCDFVISNNVPVREGFEFRGWQKEGDESTIYKAGQVVKSRSSAEPLLMKAVWAEIRTFTLVYEVNGGTGAPAVQTCKSADGGCKFLVSTAEPTKSGSKFLDWNKAGETVGPGTEIYVTETTTILVANWNPVITFKLKYTAEEDAKDLPDAQSCETAMGTCTFIVPEKEPTRSGYKFLGWRFEDKEDMLAKAGDELVVAIDGPLELKVMAVWSRIYSVLNSGEVFGAGERVVIRSVASFEGFKEFSIDSQVVPDEYFSLSEGATSIMLSNAYAQALSTGEHAFLIKWEDGEASGIISVNQNEDGTKRFTVVDVNGSTDSPTLMYRPKAGAVSKESTGAVDSATGNEESNFDAVRTIILVAVAAFVVVYIINRFYVRHKMDFIDNF